MLDRPVPAEASDQLTRRKPEAWLLTTVSIAAGIVAGLAPLAGVAAAAAGGLVLLVALRPAVAAYLWLFLTPLVVGIDRGTALPLVRPNEALLILLLTGLAGRWCVVSVSRRVQHPALTTVDICFLLLLLTGAVLPALWMVARGKGLVGQDILSAAVVAKYYLLFLLFRVVVRTEREARLCLRASLSAGAIVAVLAVLQSLDLFGVPQMLATYWGPSGGVAPGRGSATIGNAQGTADVLVFNLAIVLGLTLRRPPGRSSTALLGLAGLFLFGALGSGQVSGIIALLVSLMAAGWVLGRLPRITAWTVVAAPIAVLALSPLVARRLDSVDPSTGLPSSWSARLDNLSNYFWPELFDNYNWLLGVQLLPQAAGKEPWQPIVFIESGHTWFLWIGGVPYLLAFLGFVYIALRTSRSAARAADGAFAVAGVASVAAYSTVFVLTFLDPHLFLRGSADLAVPLLALATAGVTRCQVGGAAGKATPKALCTAAYCDD